MRHNALAHDVGQSLSEDLGVVPHALAREHFP